MEADLEPRIHSELQPDERLIWVGRPRVALMMRPAYLLVPFGVVFTGFALVWIATSRFITGSNPGFFGPMQLMPLFGIPFVVAGVLMIASPIWLRHKAGRTVYELTNRRAIVWEPHMLGGTTVRSYSAPYLGRMSRRDRRDGSGDLVFEEYVTHRTNSEGRTSTHITRRGFISIDDVRGVEDLVRRTLTP